MVSILSLDYAYNTILLQSPIETKVPGPDDEDYVS